MNKDETEKESDGIKELKKFYDMKKNEQGALRKLLQQLEKKSKKSNSEEKAK